MKLLLSFDQATFRAYKIVFYNSNCVTFPKILMKLQDIVPIILQTPVKFPKNLHEIMLPIHGPKSLYILSDIHLYLIMF